MSTNQRVALVTGAGSGIGKASSLALAAQGFSVVLTGRQIDPLNAVAREIEAQGGTALAVTCDVTSAASVDQLFAETVARFGRLDVLFNNAGRNAGSTPLDEYDVDLWNAVVATNLTGVFLCTRAAFRQMKTQTPQGGRIINNGSISAYSPRPNSLAYTATKHAISGITKSVALDGRPYDIVCSQIDIGNAVTGLTERMTRGVLQADGSLAAEDRLDVEHVAQAVAHMAGLPLGANILNMTIMASKMPFVGRG
ncbi:NADP-dependent 3-hydroxy acid dehydrogenase YdfG [Comamonas sp. BIGb0124]|mgnify:FL=1|uniref:SDR family oxidoreductase n=1 Tax=Comamonas sp. BIGb0124 TaxID=2485130 RepID=UPI000F48B244|nr:SDR family oxidoreductase [Comamonas sp. BIGb0124]ROR26540.1 NADP-dependent 3-hydroxy acid dehydrogenase YdfG [Comamonas sp. BIGb0124]